MIRDLGNLESATWALCFALQVLLIVLLAWRRNYTRFPWFTVYIAMTVVQTLASLIFYRYWGFSSDFSMEASWTIQGFVTLFRGLAVLELCHDLFANYSGIWGLIWRSMAVSVLVVLLFNILFGAQALGLRVLYADRAAGLALSVAIVCVLLFARYYQVEAPEPTRSMAVGFFLYSCFAVVNDSVLETWLAGFVPLWTFLGTLSFLGTLLVWYWALRRTALPSTSPVLLPPHVYPALSPHFNRRLAEMNERLSRFAKRHE